MPEKLIFDPSVIGGSLVGGVAMFGWHLWRTRRGDNKTDAVDGQMAELLDILRAMAAEQTKRADAFAAQRNELSDKNGKLEARLESKDEQVADLLKQVQEQRELVRSMSELVHFLLRQCPGRLPDGADPKLLTALLTNIPRVETENA